MPKTPKPTGYYPVDLDRRWRPASRRGQPCERRYEEVTCGKRGAHYCQPRAEQVIRFFTLLLVHTKGPLTRTRFRPVEFQEWEILRPLFGEVLWSAEYGCYVRRYRIAYIVLARKNGKSELAAGILLYLLLGDDEESSEVYGAAKDTKQAGMVFEPAKRMTELAPKLSKLVTHVQNSRRLIVRTTNSYYEVLTSDAARELGRNPHGFNLDEVLSQPDDSLWQAMTTAVGARLQELLFATSTETNDDASFGADLIDEAERVQDRPASAPHVFAYVRKQPRTEQELRRLRRLFPGHPDLPVSLDPWDERNWRWSNPALDAFKSRDAMRRQALEAKANARKTNGFLQFQLNMRVSQVTRWLSLDLWDANAGELLGNPDWWLKTLSGQQCWAGLDLSSKLDLTAWALLFPDGHVLWRFWCPESMRGPLDEATGGKFGQWCSAGWVTLTDGDTIDYERIYADVEVDHARYAITRIVYDKWTGEPVRQEIERRTGLELVESATTFDRMTGPMKELERRLTAGTLRHGGNPVARWMADNVDAKSPADDPERMRPVKPDRQKSTKRIDGIPALLFALDAQQRFEDRQDFAVMV